MDSLEQEYLEGRREFLQNIALKIPEIESLIITLTNLNSQESVKVELMRCFHTYKGVAGAYNLGAIGVICHKVEDYLTTSSLVLYDIDTQIDILLSLCDDLSARVKEYLSQKDIETEYGNSNSTKVKPEGETYKILLVEGSKVYLTKVVMALREFNVSIATSKNGYEAFGRILREPFDCLITATVLEELDGISLITALRKKINQSSQVLFWK